MAKLYFRYGTVNCGKSTHLVTAVHNDRTSGRRVLLLKSAVDSRWSAQHIISRVPGLQVQIDATIEFPGDVIAAVRACDEPPAFIYFDEAHFATRDVIATLRDIATFEDIPVMCYGLRTDWCLQLFDGAAALFALADEFQEIKSICAVWDKKCKRKAFSSTKHRNRQPVYEGPQVELGAEDHYCAMCYAHHMAFIADADHSGRRSPSTEGSTPE